MKLTSLTSVIRAACGGRIFSSSRAAYRPPNPPPAITILQDILARLPPWSRAQLARRGAVGEHGPGGEVAGRPGDRAAGVRAAAGEVEALDAAEAAGAR